MKCSGIDVISRSPIEVSGETVIDGVDHLIAPAAALPFVAPGFIDIQVNGFAGVDYCSPQTAIEEIGRSIRALYSTGVTRFFPTVITGSPDTMLGAVRNLARAKESLAEGESMEGFHIEGPHISPDDGPRGAHPRDCVRPPDFDEYRRWQDAANGNVKLVTLSPEYPSAPAYIEKVVREGVVVAIGHTKAEPEQIQAAVSAGATMSTHLGNGSHPVLPRHPNYIWEQMADDRLSASFITDGIHIGAAFIKVALRAKGVERSVLITDAVMPAGCAPGAYRLGEVDVELREDGSVRVRGTNQLAGSAATMDHVVSTVMRLGGVSLRDAVVMATTNAARAGRVASRLRGIAAGDRADLLLFRLEDGAIRILETYVGGQRVYAAA
jgi:N-acetylglucosamine-6-phosphate deacetylase